MEHDGPRETARRLELALDLFAFGEEMFRQNLYRAEPGITPAEVERRVIAWLRSRPGAEGGDAVGRVRKWNEIAGAAREGPA